MKESVVANWRCVLMVVSGVALAVALVFLLGSRGLADAQGPVPLAGEGGESFVHLFDPNEGPEGRFVFTFTIPAENANPWDVEVVPGAGHQDIWFTEAGTDQIGRLVYTDTEDYEFRPYPLSEGSRPLNLAWGGGFIWFTAADGDYVGRLHPETGQIDEFEVSPGSYPADLDIASDGSVWFTQMRADRIAHLVVTGTAATPDYAITEYHTPSLDGGSPYGIVVVGQSIWFAQMANDLVTCFTPADGWVHIYGFVPGVPDEPHSLVVDGSGRVWGTERSGNRVSSFFFGTFPIIGPHNLQPSDSLPTGIAVGPSDSLWFTQWGAGRIGRLTASFQKSYYPLPSPGLGPTGIAIGSDGRVWVVSSPRRERGYWLPVYDNFLPMVIKELPQ